MTIDEAKFILASHRGVPDADDPVLMEALELAGRSPELAAWLERERSHSSLIAERLREFAPPFGLRESILAGVKATGGAAAAGSSRWMWYGMAAVVAVAAFGFWMVRTPATVAEVLPVKPPMVSVTKQPQIGGMEAVVADDVKAGGHGWPQGQPAITLQALLERPDTILGDTIPVNFEAYCDAGGRRQMVAGHEVLEVCFKRGTTKYHFYIMRRSDFTAIQAPEKTECGDHNGVAYAFWADASHHYIVASAAGKDAVLALFGNP